MLFPAPRYVASEGHQFEQVIMERESPEAGAAAERQVLDLLHHRGALIMT